MVHGYVEEEGLEWQVSGYPSGVSGPSAVLVDDGHRDGCRLGVYLWRFFVTWVSLRYKTSDSNRRRWPVQVFWQIVCNAVLNFGVVTGVARIVQRKPRMESLSRQVRGMLVTMAALEQTAPGVGDGWDTESGVLGAAGAVMDKVREWALEDGFRQEVNRRAGRLAFMS